MPEGLTSPLRRNRAADAESPPELPELPQGYATERLLPVSPKASGSRSQPNSPGKAEPVVQIGEPIRDGPLRLIRMVAFILLGLGIGSMALLAAESSSALRRLALVENYGMGPLYLALVLLHLAYHTVAAQLGTVYRPTRIEMPDSKVYRVLDGGPGVSGALVLTQDAGAFARYTRAQQAAASMEESMPLFVAHLAAAGFVLPWTALMLSIVFSLSRAASAVRCAFGLTQSLQQTNSRGRAVSLSHVTEGAAAGVCLFVGLTATARELLG